MRWWQTSVVYQVYPRSFRDTTGNGVGDLAGVIQQLDYLAELGIGAVWLSPFYPSPMADFGYDVSDYVDVDPLFDDLATFDRLVDEAHGRGIRLIIDWVPNHSSDQHPWFLESRSSRTNPKHDWYVWRDAKPDGSPPNNWVALFGGSSWEWDDTRQQYYLHTFLKEQPELNWRCRELRAAMLDTLRFWLDRGVDGFRMDVVNFIMKDPEFRDNPPNPAADAHRSPWFHSEYESQLHVHDKMHPDVHELFREFRRIADSYEGDRVLIGEIEPEPWDRWVRHYGTELDEIQIPFNFGLIDTAWSATTVAEHIGGFEAALPPGAWPNYVLGNHDQVRLATRIGRDHARLAAMLLLTVRGTPTMYYGDELGIEQAEIAPEDQQDPYGRRVPGQGRDGCRTPMQWDASPSAGFSSAPPEELWLPLSSDHATANVAAQLEDPDSLLTLYRTLLELRAQHPALHAGDIEVRDATDDVLTYTRSVPGERWLIALNFSDAPRRLQLDEPGRIVVSTAHRDAAFTDGELALAGAEGVLVAITPPAAPAPGVS